MISLIALLTSAPAAQAQMSHNWSVCFNSGVMSCTDIYLSTTPTLGGAGGARDGTLMSLMLRQRDRGVPTGLLGFALGFGLGATDQSDLMYTMPTPVGGAQANAVGVRWYLGASRSNSPSGLNFLYGGAETDPSQSPSPTAWIGGCLSPSNNAFWSVNNVACGSGQAFSFQWTTAVEFDAAAVLTVGVDAIAIDQQALYAGAGGGYCQGPASGGVGVGVGFDGYDPSNAFPCDIGAAEPLDPTIVPEPRTVVLLASALSMLGVWRRRRRAA